MGKKAQVLRVEWRTDQRWRDFEWVLVGGKVGLEDLGALSEGVVYSYEALSGPSGLSQGSEARRGEKKKW